jgi:pyrophosphate--fructose-6-phosphate 1-phosphotransferase
MLGKNTPFEEERLKVVPQIPKIFRDLTNIEVIEKRHENGLKTVEEVRPYFPHTFEKNEVQFTTSTKEKKPVPLRVGVVLSGGQAAGGHNVIAGLFDAINLYHPSSQLFGFLGGPSGIIEGKYIPITHQLVSAYRNTGGFDMIGSGRTKIETPDQMQASLECMQKLSLDGLCIIGGDDSNTNAALLAEYFQSKKCATCVIGVPKTIDGDVKNSAVEVSFGFDTACKVYAEMIGNICRDALSAKKYYHFVKLMGRSASHIALECALQTHPNITLLGEEVASHKKTLQQISVEIADVICTRSESGKNYGIVLIPEGLVEFIPEMKQLIKEINTILAKGTHSDLVSSLSEEAKATLAFMPDTVQRELLLERDPHGNVQVSHIATEELIIFMVKKELKKRDNYKGKFNPVRHFFGYEGRSAFPSNFDTNYCYALGMGAAVLMQHRYSGYMSIVNHLTAAVHEWKAGGIPLTKMMRIEERRGAKKPVVQKTLVDLEGAPFSELLSQREKWNLEDDYMFPGPMQFFGPPELCDSVTHTLSLEQRVKAKI